jgi:hypothetical protein
VLRVSVKAAAKAPPADAAPKNASRTLNVLFL